MHPRPSARCDHGLVRGRLRRLLPLPARAGGGLKEAPMEQPESLPESIAAPAWEGAVCPAPIGHRDRIVLGHGSGGRLSRELFERIFEPAFDNAALRAGDDAADLGDPPAGARPCLTTDAHVVSPLFFPGGDIGRLAVCGTVK